MRIKEEDFLSDDSRTILTCDRLGCLEKCDVTSARKLGLGAKAERGMARADGWKVKIGHHLCPKHAAEEPQTNLNDA